MTSASALVLAEKLRLQRRRMLRPDQTVPSSRDLADRTADENGVRAISHSVISDVLAGNKGNPPLSTITALAAAFGVPAPYLLPGWDDLTSLKVYSDQASAREALRLVADLGPEGGAALLAAARRIRAAAGLGTEPPTQTPVPPTAVKVSPGRKPRSLDR